MLRADKEVQFVREERSLVYMFLGLHTNPERHIHAIIFKQAQALGGVCWLHGYPYARKTLLELPQYGRQQILAGGGTRSHPQPPLVPAIERLQLRAGAPH